MKIQRDKIKPILLSLCLLLAFLGSSQNTYLKISKSNKANDYEKYPPGTKFELKNVHGYIVFKNSDDPGFIDITEKHFLHVYPSWKSTTDVFELLEGRVEKVLIDINVNSELVKASIKSNGVTAQYTVSDSKVLKGKKNLKFKLSNGIAFNYTEGKFNAYLNEEDNYLNVEEKYLIQSEMGTLKLSFNPNNGITWWVFEPVKK